MALVGVCGVVSLPSGSLLPLCAEIGFKTVDGSQLCWWLSYTLSYTHHTTHCGDGRREGVMSPLHIDLVPTQQGYTVYTQPETVFGACISTGLVDLPCTELHEGQSVWERCLCVGVGTPGNLPHSNHCPWSGGGTTHPLSYNVTFYLTSLSPATCHCHKAEV